MTRKNFLKACAIAVLAIVWTSGAWGKVVSGVSAIMGICVLLWRFRRPILSRVDAAIEKDPFSIGAIAIMMIFICVIGGGGAYNFLGGNLKDAEPFFYPIGVVIILLMFFCILRFTDRHLPPSNRDDE